MRLEFFEKFKDPYMQKDNPEGRGVFLAGIVFGMIARGQVDGKDSNIDAAPIYKQLNFGRMQYRDIRDHMSRVPGLTRMYDIPGAGWIESLCGEAGKLLMEGGSKDLGIDGNFAFSVAFLNARHYFFDEIFKDEISKKQSESRSSDGGDQSKQSSVSENEA